LAEAVFIPSKSGESDGSKPLLKTDDVVRPLIESYFRVGRKSIGRWFHSREW